MIGSVIGVYNGKVFNTIEIKAEMLGFYLAEFSVRPRNPSCGPAVANASARPRSPTSRSATDVPVSEPRSRRPSLPSSNLEQRLGWGVDGRRGAVGACGRRSRFLRRGQLHRDSTPHALPSGSSRSLDGCGFGARRPMGCHLRGEHELVALPCSRAQFEYQELRCTLCRCVLSERLRALKGPLVTCKRLALSCALPRPRLPTALHHPPHQCTCRTHRRRSLLHHLQQPRHCTSQRTCRELHAGPAYRSPELSTESSPRPTSTYSITLTRSPSTPKSPVEARSPASRLWTRSRR